MKYNERDFQIIWLKITQEKPWKSNNDSIKAIYLKNIFSMINFSCNLFILSRKENTKKEKQNYCIAGGSVFGW